MAVPERKHQNTNSSPKNGAGYGARRRRRPASRIIENTTPVVTKAGSAFSTDEQFNAQYSQAGLQPTTESSSQERIPYQEPQLPTRSPQVEYISNPNTATFHRKNKRGRRKKTSVVTTNLARARALSRNIGIWSWGGFSYIFQLIFGILSVLFFVIAGAIDAMTGVLKVKADDGAITSGIKTTITTVSDFLYDAATVVLDSVGLNIGALQPVNYFIITYMLVFAYGMILLLSIYLIYKISLLNPLSGQGGGWKIGAFLLALVGYSVPFLNLLPWFIPWTLVVLWKPK